MERLDSSRMTYTIGKAFTFAASHQLDGLSEGHQCGRLHGHNYTVSVELAADELDDTGMVEDFGDLAPFKAWLDSTLDHRHLNDVLDANPTAENLARYLYGMADHLLRNATAVTVWETPTCWATYRP